MIRPLRGFIGATIILVLGLVAFGRLEMAQTDQTDRSDLIISLSLPRPLDLDEVARSFVSDIESAVRNVTSPRRISGEIWQDGAWLRVTLPSADEVTAKSARLSTELEPLRDRLPEGARLNVFHGGEGSTGEVMIVALKGQADPLQALAIRDSIRSVTGVRDVRLLGVPSPAIQIHLDPRTSPEMASSIVETVRSSQPRLLGGLEIDGRRVAVFSDRPQVPLEERPVSLDQNLTVNQLAEVRRGARPSAFRLRIDGEESAGLIVYREARGNIFEIDREIRARISQIHSEQRVEMEVLESAAEDLSLLLDRWLLALLTASISMGLLALIGRRRHSAVAVLASALVPWTAAGGVLLALFASGRPADTNAFVVIILSNMMAIPFALMVQEHPFSGRLQALGIWAGSILLIPVVIELISSVALVDIAADSVLLVLAFVAAAISVTILPQYRVPVLPRTFVRPYRRILAGSATSLLVFCSALFVLFTAFGGALDPENEAPVTRVDELRAQVRLPSGGTIEHARGMIEVAERELSDIPGIERVVSQYGASGATLRLELDPEQRARADYLRISLETQYRLAALGISADVRPPTLQNGDLTSRGEQTTPFTDADAFSYRGVLRGASASDLQLAVGRIRDRTASGRVAAHRIHVEREKIEPRLELVMRQNAPSDVRAEIERVVAESGGTIATIPLIDELGGSIELRPWWSKLDDAEPRTVHDLLSQPTRADNRAVAPAQWTSLRETYHAAAMPREDGQFVQVFSTSFPWTAEWLRKRIREQFHGSLRTMQLPHGVDLRLPEMKEAVLNERRLRMIGIFATAPIVFLAFGMFALNRRFFEPAAAILPAIAATATGAVVLRTLAIPMSAIVILTLLLAGAMALSVSILLLKRERTGREKRSHIRQIYRVGRESFRVVILALLPLTAGFVALTAGVDPSRYAWQATFTLAGFVSAAGLLAATIVPANVLLLLTDLTRLPEEAEASRAKSRTWLDPRTRPDLEARNIVKIYPNGHQALAGVSFDIEPSIIALLGPNGAGKSTLIRIMTGLLQPTRGQLSFNGKAVEERDLPLYRRVVGYLPQEFNAYPHFTAEEFLDYWAIEIGVESRQERAEEIEQILVAVGLAEHARRKVRDFSGGMRQRIGIARSLLGAPPVVIVDEPTTGLDIESRQRLRSTLRSIAVRRIVILSTHIASDVEGTASRVLLLNQGLLRFDGTPDELTRFAEGHSFEAMVDDRDLHELTRQYRITARVRTVDGIHVRGVARSDQTLPGSAVAPNLEEGYLTIIDETAANPGKRGRHYSWIREIFG